MLGHLKKWGQHKVIMAEDKYGVYTRIRPQHIVVTSNFSPSEIWSNPRDLLTISRRFRIFHMESNYYPIGHKLHTHVPHSLFKFEDPGVLGSTRSGVLGDDDLGPSRRSEPDMVL